MMTYPLQTCAALNLEGSSTSYAQFARWWLEPGLNSTLELEFRTRAKEVSS